MVAQSTCFRARKSAVRVVAWFLLASALPGCSETPSSPPDAPGDPSGSPPPPPSPPPAPPVIRDVSPAMGHTCALATDGRVFCWGQNGFGQVGNGTDESI